MQVRVVSFAREFMLMLNPICIFFRVLPLVVARRIEAFSAFASSKTGCATAAAPARSYHHQPPNILKNQANQQEAKVLFSVV
jgi:hypothetical protein